MTSVLDQAQNVQGVVSAARRRERWQRAEANATDPERREQYREAIADLEARFPELEQVGPGGAEAFARERGHGTGARSSVHNGRRRLSSKGKGRPPKQPADLLGKVKQRTKKPVPGLDPNAKRGRRAKSGPTRPAPTPRVDRAIRQTGIPSAVDSTGSMLMAGLGTTVGLSLAYLVFSSAETPGSGANAVPSVIRGITRALGRLIEPVDVFPSNHHQQAPAGQPSQGTGGHATASAKVKTPGSRGPLGSEGWWSSRPKPHQRQAAHR